MTKILAGTGHRPNKLGFAEVSGYSERARERLEALACSVIHVESPALVISGMALGWDMALAEAAVLMGTPFDAYIPFEGQERRWPEESQARYWKLMEQASEVVVCSEGGYGVWKMQVRNERMVDACTKVAALWDGSDGGTANCVRYAMKVEKPIRNFWSSWAKYAAWEHKYEEPDDT